MCARVQWMTQDDRMTLDERFLTDHTIAIVVMTHNLAIMLPLTPTANSMHHLLRPMDRDGLPTTSYVQEREIVKTTSEL